MLFHYYSLWFIPKDEINMYPYGNTYDYFSYGYLGVHFFFMLSGFVVAYSLSGSINFVTFWKKKLIRLLPPIILCSLTTLFVFRILDTGNLLERAHSFKNVLTSMALISPDIINHIFGTHRDYINGSYWFLWPEVQFYFIASVLYFFSKKHFIRNYAFLSIFIHASYYVINRIITNTFSTNRLHLHLSTNSISQYQFWTSSFNFIEYNLLFLIGILLFQLYAKQFNKWTLALLGLTVLIEFKHLDSTENWIVMGMIALFLLVIYVPHSLDWISSNPLEL
jgi:peptidoglycan/LPS O-acetylase OafA/YrhL